MGKGTDQPPDLRQRPKTAQTVAADDRARLTQFFAILLDWDTRRQIMTGTKHAREGAEDDAGTDDLD